MRLENAGLENAAPKLQNWNLRELNSMEHQSPMLRLSTMQLP